MQPENACPISGWCPLNKDYPVLDYSDRELFVLSSFLNDKIFPLKDVRNPPVYETWHSDWVEIRRRALRSAYVHKSCAGDNDDKIVSNNSAAIAMGNTISGA
eukprot:Selendium_serpulae@DN4861_c0_g1_i3.p1